MNSCHTYLDNPNSARTTMTARGVKTGVKKLAVLTTRLSSWNMHVMQGVQSKLSKSLIDFPVYKFNQHYGGNCAESGRKWIDALEFSKCLLVKMTTVWKVRGRMWEPLTRNSERRIFIPLFSWKQCHSFNSPFLIPFWLQQPQIHLLVFAQTRDYPILFCFEDFTD